jgi:hypothetical protein
MGFRELLKDSITEAFTYRTTKLVKTNDRFLVTLHFIFMSLIATFALVSILLSHNYMLFELPSMYVTTAHKKWGQTPFTVNSTLSEGIESATGAARELYCKDADYVEWRRDGRVYDDAFMASTECVARMSPAEYIWTFDSGNGFSVGTYVEVQSKTFTCTGTTSITECPADTPAGTTYSYFIAGADMLNFGMEVRYQTRTGALKSADKVVVNEREYEVTSRSEVPQVSFQDLLQVTGINTLDEENPAMVGDRGSVTGLPYRLSGLRINMKVTFANTYFDAPLKTTSTATLAGEPVPSNHYNSKTTVQYLRSDDAGRQASPVHHDLEKVFYTWAMTTISFVPSGQIGTFDFFALALAVTNAFVLIGMATTIVDFVGVMSSETFLDDKYEDDGERLGLEMMLANIENEAHPGVPFDPNDLRLTAATGELGQSYEKTLEQLLEEVREIQEQLSLLPEDEADLRKITTGHADEEEFRKLRLVYIPDPLSTEANDKKYVPPEILLHNGQQTIGRGMGGVENKGVSRQQFSVAVVKERIRMKSLHEGPGVWRQSTGRWELLPVGKSAVLSVGDRLCFRMREGKIGGHEGVFALDFQDATVEFAVFGIPCGTRR